MPTRQAVMPPDPFQAQPPSLVAVLLPELPASSADHYGSFRRLQGIILSPHMLQGGPPPGERGGGGCLSRRALLDMQAGVTSEGMQLVNGCCAAQG